MSLPNPSPPVSVMVKVATPPIMLQLGWVRVRGLWQEPETTAVLWRARRAARARWGPAAAAERQAWKEKGL